MKNTLKTRERLEIWLRAKEIYLKELEITDSLVRKRFGICGCVMDAYEEKMKPTVSRQGIFKLFPELRKRKPVDALPYWFWWDWEDTTSRIIVFDSIIEELKNKLT